jgi:hypothetical protein
LRQIGLADSRQKSVTRRHRTDQPVIFEPQRPLTTFLVLPHAPILRIEQKGTHPHASVSFDRNPFDPIDRQNRTRFLAQLNS